MTTVVTRRVVRNKRLGQAAHLWALPMLAHSPGAHAHFTARRERGDSYSAAARNLTNRGIGMLHHCLRTGQHYDEAKAFPTTTRQPVTSGRPQANKALRETEAPHHRVDDMNDVKHGRDPYRASDHQGLSKDRGTPSLTT